MTVLGWIQALAFFAVIVALTPPLGGFLQRVMEGERHVLRRPLGVLERLVLRLAAVDPAEQSWPRYASALLSFSALSLLATFVMQRVQHLLPLNPQGLGDVEATSAFNTAVSFTTNTNCRATRARPRCRTSRRWPVSPGRTSSRPPRGSPSRWPSPAA